MPNDPRTGRAWQQLLTLCKTSYPWTCHLCGQTIPRTPLPRGHPLEYQADHIITVDAEPRLAMRLSNLRPSHGRCNRARSNRPLTTALIQEITARFAPPSRPALAFFELEPREGGGVDDLTSAAPEGEFSLRACDMIHFEDLHRSNS